MDTSLWSDDEFRSFFASLRGDFFATGIDDIDRERFIAQARVRVAPEVQRRVLADIGATTDAAGIARVTFELLEEQAWGKRRTWMLVTSDPWGMLTDLVTREVRSSYRSSVRRRGTKGDLDGIARVSSRPALPSADIAADDDAAGESLPAQDAPADA